MNIRHSIPRSEHRTGGARARIALHAVIAALVVSAASSVAAELNNLHRDTVRGRYVPVNEQEMSDRWGVILWDESQSGKTGSSTGQQKSTGIGNIQKNAVTTDSFR
ncbi:hypothetical protein GCM10007160_08630 [Litchfieldella qijiaojingensis]|uniref:Uncharacterized protein n=1 Tax=Litchfieldella qijiaojingensis TaxID=980347 RepID=A0ABQ2YHC1_9GAMM|nr:hypothetical protein [Halomonas qijiaojingensis]GGX83666.1 hypothetical protein GCM10007160_08630 [Halomonas qijiaojingensis]